MRRGDSSLSTFPFGGNLWDFDMGMDSFSRRLENLERSLFPELGTTSRALRGIGGGAGLGQEIMRIPNVDFKETNDKFQIVAEMPGVDKKDIKVDLDEDTNVLTLSGEHKEEKEDKGDRYYFKERSFGSFKRSFRLPDNIKKDEVRASMNQGLLNIDIPKVEISKEEEKKEKRRTIDVSDIM